MGKDIFQDTAVNCSSNVLLIAGPGAGKTRTVATKISQLLNNSTGLDDILALSFSKDAARELYKRVPKLPRGAVRTIHSFARSFLPKDLKVISSADPEILDNRKLILLNHHGATLQTISKLWAEPAVQDRVNSALDSIDKFKSTPDSLLPDEFEEDYSTYQSYLKKYNLIDFNDMLIMGIEAAKIAKPEFEWLFLDEGHDTNMLQYELLRCVKAKHVWGVFSPHQMIYRWNGADERNLERFQEDYKPEKFLLQNNWRSNKVVVDLLEDIYPDNLIPMNETKGEVKLFRLSPNNELPLLQDLCKGRDYMILARVNSRLPSRWHPNLKNLSTIHKSKGTEAEDTVVLGCGDHLIPYYKSADIEEEKNLLYVAASRAKSNLYLFYNEKPSPLLGKLAGQKVLVLGGKIDE